MVAVDFNYKKVGVSKKPVMKLGGGTNMISIRCVRVG